MRKLAIVCAGFAAAVFVGQYLLPGTACLFAAGLALAALVLAAFIFKDTARLRAVLALAGLCAGFFYNGVFYRVVYDPALALEGSTREVAVTVAGFPEETDYGWRAVVRLDTGGPVPAKSTLYVYYDQGDLSGVRPGDRIRTTAVIQAADAVRGEETSYYNAQGIVLFIKARSQVSIEPAARVPARYLPLVMCRAVTDKLGEIYPEKYAPFMKALLAGYRGDINRNLVLTARLSKVGLSHVIAVSGMHVSFLVGFLGLLVPNRRRFALVAIPFLVLFSMMLGGAPSVVRASFMQIMLLIAPALRRENDSLTSLSAVLFLLLLLNPFSAKNIGLQMSFASTAGIVLISGRLQNRLLNTTLMRYLEKKLPRPKLFKRGTGRNALLYFICATIGTTIGATAFTWPLSALYFDYVSLIAPVTNLLALPAVSAAFVLGVVTVLLGFIWMPLALMVSFGVQWLSAYIFAVIDIFSRIPLAAVYTENPYVAYWLVFVYVLVAAWYFIRDGRRPVFLPISLGACGLALALGLGYAQAAAPALTAAFLDVGQGACSVVTGGKGTVVVDCGGNRNAGSVCAQYLWSMGKKRIDYLLLTHTHADHVSGVEVLVSMVDTAHIVMPVPQEGDAEAEKILRLAQETGTEVILVDALSALEAGELDILIYPPQGSAGENEIGLSFIVSRDNFDILYTGDMDADSERRLASLYRLPDVEALAVGHHGSKYSTSQALLDAARPEVAVISVGYNTYGHPTREVMDRLTQAGAQIHRTDLEGRVRIRYCPD